MAKFISRYSTEDDEDLRLQELAEKLSVKAPAQKKGALQKVVELLNKPSELTEKALTGGKSYEEAGLGKKSAFAARLVLDPLNLVGPLGVGSKALKGAGLIGKAATKVPGVATAATATGDLLIPGYKLSKVSPELAKALPTLERAITARQAQAVKKAAELGKGFKSKELRESIGKLVEKQGMGGQLADDELEAVTKAKSFIEETITAPEKAAGVAPKEVAYYFPRKADREGVENLLKFGGKRLSLSLGGSEKARTFTTQAAGEAAGITYKNPIEALALRASKSEAAVSNKKFINQLVDGSIKDIDGNPLVTKIGKTADSGYRELTGPLRGFQAPAEAADELEKYFRTFVSDDATNALLKFYDSALGVWKGSVTSLFPAFHIRNAIGNLSNMWLGGFNPQDIPKLATAASIQKGGSVVIKGTKVTRESLEELGLIGRGQFGADIPKAVGDVLGNKSLLQKVNPLERGRQAGTLVEDNAKIAFFLQRLGKGDDVNKALAQTHKYLFDYSALTDFEKNVMRRVIPFYTWARKNIPLQVETLITKPGRQAAITKTFSNLSPLTDEEKEALPTYLTEGLTAKLPSEGEGELKAAYSFGMPIEDIGRLFRGSAGRTFEREILGAAGPLGNALGIGLKRDFYRGKETKELAYSYGRMSKDYPEAIKDFLEFKEEKGSKGQAIYRVNPTKFQIIATIAPRILRTIGTPSAGYESFKTVNVNLESAKASKQRELEDQLGDLLLEKGAVKEFKKIYIPSEGSSKKSKFITRY